MAKRQLVPHDFKEGAVPATPAANYVRLYAAADGKLYSIDDAGAVYVLSERTKRIILPLPGIPPDATGTGNNPATSRKVVNSGTQRTNAPKATHEVLDFDGTTDESRMWDIGLLSDYVSGGLIRLKFGNATTTAANVVWKGAMAQATDLSTDIDSVTDAFDTVALSAATAAPTTIGQITEATITLTGGYTAGRASLLMIGRDADNGSDTLNGLDAVLVRAMFEYQVS